MAAPLPLVLALFAFTGATGLIYELVWVRMLTLVLGATVHAVSTVLAVFMGGMALGSWFFGRMVDRRPRRSLRLYGALELAVGLYALATPLLMGVTDTVYRAAWPALSDSPLGLSSLRVGLAALVLIVPATLMGGSLPALARFAVRDAASTGARVGALYSWNTLGAFVGCLACGFVLLELLGLRATLWVAASVNLVVGVTALVLGGRAKPTGAAKADAAPSGFVSAPSPSPSRVRLALVLFAATGALALAVEVLWTRSLMYFVSIDTWAFAAMLAAFLAGIGLGGLVTARFVDRLRDPLLALGFLEVLIGLAAAVSLPMLRAIHEHDLIAAWLGGARPGLAAKLLQKLLPSMLVMLVPTLAMGAAFVVFSRVYVAARRAVGRGVGTLYALNTLGAIVGSLGAGFALIPWLGVQRAILAVAAAYVAVGCVLVAAARSRSLAGAAGAGVLAAVAAVWLPAEPIARLGPEFRGGRAGTWRVLHTHEGADATLAVLENRNGTRALEINGVVTAVDNYMDLQVHRMLSHLPMLLHPDPDRVLVVGFGMGSTVWGCCQYDVDRVDVVELLRHERVSARYFEHVNHGVLDHPRLRFLHGDGRNLLLGTRERYDVISFNAIHPRYSANLYTVDFYRLCAERLTEDGVVCAWMTQNSMTDAEWRMLCRSFTEVFPHVSLWYSNPQHFCLVGGPRPLAVDLGDWRRRMARPGVAEDLRASYLDDPFSLLARYAMGDAALRDYVGDGPLNTDDHPRIEFSRERKDEERAIAEKLVAHRRPISESVRLRGVSAADREELQRAEKAASWLMRGQLEVWYPSGPFAAETALRRALLARPESQDVRAALGFADDVVRAAEHALRRAPAEPFVLASRGRLALELGDLEVAERLLGRALRSGRVDPETRLHHALVALFAARWEVARARLEALLQGPHLEGRPELAALALAAWARVLERAGAADRAREAARRAEALGRGATEVLALRQRCVRRLRD